MRFLGESFGMIWSNATGAKALKSQHAIAALKRRSSTDAGRCASV